MRVVDLGIVRIEILRHQPLLEHPVDRILISRLHEIGREARRVPRCLRRIAARRRSVPCGLELSRAIKLFIAPDRHAVATPIEREGPARDRLAGIPFALAVMQQAAGRETIAQTPDQFVGALALLRTERVGIPFRRLIVVDRDEGRLAAHGETHVMFLEIGVDFFAERVERGPSLVGKGSGDAGRSASRFTVMSKSKVTSPGSTRPLIGAAE